MHLYLIIRSQLNDYNRLISDLEAQYFFYEIEKDGKKHKTAMQLGVRVWGGMVELAFPETALQEVLRMLEPFSTYSQYIVPLYLIRKTLRLDKCPAVDMKLPKRPTWRASHPDIHITILGIKKDKYGIVPDGLGGTFYGEQV